MTQLDTRRLRPVDPPDDADDGAAPRRRLPRRSTFVLLAVGVVVVALVVTWIVVFSPVFGVRTVKVLGTKQLSAAQVRTAASIKHGTPLVRLDTAAVTRRVERLPEVESAQVSTSFPSTVTVTVVERTPVGYIASDGKDVLVDSDGVQYRTVSKAPAHLPRFVVPTGTLAKRTAAALGTVAGALTPALRAVVTSIQALDPTSITLTVKGGTLVRWGSAARSADKARVLPALLKLDAGQVDLTDPDQPYVH